jgi:hypothetical protein
MGPEHAIPDRQTYRIPSECSTPIRMTGKCSFACSNPRRALCVFPASARDGIYTNPN